MRGKPLIFRKLDNGCIVPISHKLNKDGYFRYTIPNKDGKGRKDEAKNYWMQTKCTGSYLASLFCVSFSTACKWIREWKV